MVDAVHCKVHPAVAIAYPCPLCMVAAEVRVMKAGNSRRHRINTVEEVIAEELGRGDKDYTWLAKKIVEVLDDR